MCACVCAQDEENDNPQLSADQIITAEMDCAGVTIGTDELEVISKTSVAVFEVLERSWASLGLALVDLKLEFGVDMQTSQSISI